MTTVFVDKQWHEIFSRSVRLATEEIFVVTPFIQGSVVRELFADTEVRLRIITRFNLRDFYDGASDLAALEFLLGRGSEIKGVRNLHAKVYVFDSSRAIVTSANLTQAALRRNPEFGLETSNADLVSAARSYFERLWKLATPCVTAKHLAKWRKTIAKIQLRGRAVNLNGELGDYGADLGFIRHPSETDHKSAAATQWFVKFFGEGHNRVAWDFPVFEEVKGSGCHWACTYPKGKRPRRVRDGAVMFMARLVKSPKDIVIFGRAIGLKHVHGRDDASASDIRRRRWKERWPHYVRVRDAEFVAGTLSNGVSLNELMDELHSKAFTSTERHMIRGKGNLDPRRAIMQQPGAELTRGAAEWLSSRVSLAFRKNGKLSDSDLKSLDWPDVN